MALQLTDAAQNAANKLNVQPQIVLAIEGVDTVFGAQVIYKSILVGEDGLYIDGTWSVGGLNPVADQEDLITLDTFGTTINQQLMPDKGSVSSLSSISLTLLDQNDIITQLVSPGQVVADVLGRNAKVLMGFQETSYPEDYVEIFRGIIDEIDSGPGNVRLNVVHPDRKKQQEIFSRADTQLDARTQTATISIASPAVVTATAHGMVADQPVSFTTTGVLPTGITAGTTYYARNVTANTFELATSAGGGSLSTSGSQSGTHTLRRGMNASDTQIYALDRSQFFTGPALGPDGGFDGAFTACVQIDDELILVFGGALFTNRMNVVQRGYLGTTPAAHAIGAKITSFYLLEDDAMNLALKLMLSRPGKLVAATGTQNFVENIPITAIQQISPTLHVANAVYFDGIDLEEDYGLVSGDFIQLRGTSAGNDSYPGWVQIISIVQTDTGSYATINVGLSFDESPWTLGYASTGTAGFRSQFDSLPDGLGMDPREVDVAQHLRWRELALSAFSYRFYLKDTIQGKDFLDQEIYKPCGAYSLPRQGKASVGYTIGPIPDEDIPVLGEDNIKSPSKVRLKRTLSRNFYNTVAYKFDESATEDKFQSGLLGYAADSQSRIPVGNSVFTVESKGMRTDLSAAANVGIAAQRLLNRYKYAAEYFENVEVFFKTGFAIEPGDLVILDPEGLQISNTADGTRTKPAKFYEVTNKKTDLKTGNMVLTLVDTAYSSGEHFGLVSPSSQLAAGSTVSELIIKDSFGALYPGDESRKWTNYVGLPVLVHDENFTWSHTATFIGVDPQNPYKLLLDPSTALPSPPPAGYIVDIPTYSLSADPRVERLYKLIHCHLGPEITVTGGVDSTHFTVAPGDVARFQVGFPVLLHDAGFTQASAEVKVKGVIGSTVEVDSDLGFTPTAGMTASLLGFDDGEQVYRIL